PAARGSRPAAARSRWSSGWGTRAFWRSPSARPAPKSAFRIDALGCVDELNAALGMARASGANPEWVALIDKLQEKLIGLMGQLATLPEDMGRYMETKFPLIEQSDVDWVIAEAHQYEARGIRFTGWARPGAEGCMARAAVDFARSVARRAERSILTLHESGETVPETVRLFFNKLADLLWILARVECD
ncbi:MAG: ATP:cob(I)alamin adenosyltransferase, partial [Gloeobacteraceae cyanobacterium ES-bin-144]|nr:ATP:cob(I)alamin adenosyltransferase [Verrucomicrobiales bacterium]